MPPSLHAETLTIDRQITGIVHHYMPPEPMFEMPGYVTDEILFDTTGLTNVDLNQYQTFKLRLFAPAGQKVVANHADSYRSGVSIYYHSGGDSSSRTEPATLTFEEFTGSMPTRDYSLFYIGDNGNVLNFQANEVYPAGGTEFTAMSYTFTPTYNPPNSPKNFTQQSSFGYPVYFSYQTPAATDPGPFVSLAANVPLTVGISTNAGQISIGWMTRPNQHYQVEATTDLSSPASWADFGGKILGDGGLRSVGDLIGETRAKFYRVHILPQSSNPTP